MERLTAKNNDKIKAAISLRDSSKSRRKAGLFFLEGARLCSDAALSGREIYRAFFTEDALEKYADKCSPIIEKAEECYCISDEISQKMSDTQSSQGIFCLCRMNNISLDKIDYNGKYIMLENVQDPSNFGAVSRTAEALGINGIIIFSGCDIYNPKALRASMGSSLRLNIFTCENAVEFIENANANGMLTLASTPSSDAEKINSTDMAGGVICVVGNEGNGITPETMRSCKKRVTIPMGGRAESLNAATAASILIWEMMKNDR